MKHYLNPDQRRKSIKVWVSDEERALVEAKAYNYGYRRIAPYIRDAAIYERVTMGMPKSGVREGSPA